jgi:thiol:disulfide interchange protein DsbA
MNLFRRLVHGFLAACAALAILGAGAQGVTQALPLTPPQPVENDGKIEVLEFFAYGCIHCANLEPRVKEWVSKLPPDVKFRRVPAAFPTRGIESIPIFYTLEAIGQLERMHQKVFDAANLENVQLGHGPTLLKWLEKNGISPADYESARRSFSVDGRIRRAMRMSQDYKINSTPTFVVDGRHLIIPGSDGQLFAVIDQVVAETRRKLNAAAPAVAPVAAPAKAAATPKKVAEKPRKEAAGTPAAAPAVKPEK